MNNDDKLHHFHLRSLVPTLASRIVRRRSDACVSREIDLQCASYASIYNTLTRRETFNDSKYCVYVCMLSSRVAVRVGKYRFNLTLVSILWYPVSLVWTILIPYRAVLQSSWHLANIGIRKLT